MPNNNSPANWAGWGYFASVMAVLLGVFQGVSGLAAIFKNGFFGLPESQLLVFNYTAWGWITLVLGVLLIAGGLELMRGAACTRPAVVVLAALSFVASVCMLNAFQLWEVLMLVVNVVVIYALTVRSRE
jgi:hypothetical protein